MVSDKVSDVEPIWKLGGLQVNWNEINFKLCMIIIQKKEEKLINIYQCRWHVEPWILQQQVSNLFQLTVAHMLLVLLEKDQWIQLTRLSISLSRFNMFNNFQLSIFIFLFITSLSVNISIYPFSHEYNDTFVIFFFTTF